MPAHTHASLPAAPSRWKPAHGLLLLWAVAALLSLTLGAGGLSLADCGQALLHGLGVDTPDLAPTKAVIFWDIRMPRFLLASVTGAALAMAGTAMQGLLRNPLAEPGLLGVSSGAALFTLLALVAGASVATVLGAFLLPVSAFVGSLLMTVLLFLLARWMGQVNGVFLVLAGLGITACTEALIGILVFFSDDASLRTFTFWRMGGFGGATWLTLAIAAPLLAVALTLLVRMAPKLDLLSLGEQEAAYMGLSVSRVRTQVIVLIALAVGTSVAFSGLIAFVGLAVPHMVRLVAGANQRRVLPLTALSGAALLVLADSLARTLVAPAELPVGLLTALIGAPTLLWIVTREFRRTRFA